MKLIPKIALLFALSSISAQLLSATNLSKVNNKAEILETCDAIINSKYAKEYLNKIDELSKYEQRATAKFKELIIYDNDEQDLYKHIHKDFTKRPDYLKERIIESWQSCAKIFLEKFIESNNDIGLRLFASGGLNIATAAMRIDMGYRFRLSRDPNINKLNFPVFIYALLIEDSDVLKKVHPFVINKMDSHINKIKEKQLEKIKSDNKLKMAQKYWREHERPLAIERQGGPASPSQMRSFKHQFSRQCLSNGKMNRAQCDCVAESLIKEKYPNSIYIALARGAVATGKLGEEASTHALFAVITCSFR